MIISEITGEPIKRPRRVSEILDHPAKYFLVWNSEAEVHARSDNAPEDIPYIQESYDQPGETWVRTRPGYIEAINFAPRMGTIVTGIPVKAVQAGLTQFALKLFSISAGIIGLGLGIGWWMTGRATRELKQIALSSERIAHGDLSERIDLDFPSSEVGALAEVLNDSFSKLEGSFQQQVRFTADASHELRTPVSVVLTTGQFALSKDRNISEYKKAISTCVDSAMHMKKVIESLLEIARYDSGETALNLQEHDLAKVANESIELLQALAKRKRITITTSFEPTFTKIDPHRMLQVCINLLSNAIKYSTFGTEVSITVREEEEDCLLVVADRGVGIAEKDLPFLFDRFFRGKRTTGDENEHTGLGLAITKSIILAHGGTIQASNRSQGGALFRITLPKS
ncbi:HAMP domain-containing sensor histidine kinase [Pelagicoccus mobilis]|uniref:histidine kinase n=1 Tax=Pelagicoccus mobilis TaxID=415221 RepID=A0A934RTJ6_9BACT|nr:ATP-binding protein [Pelagicoccus mobilis]MBK1877330.1 HAMP domain-containing protein [Pelagicoccus mobilis]